MTVVRYFNRMSSGRRGSSGAGTSASGAAPTDVSGSVSSHTWKSNGIAERMASSSCSRRVIASPPAAQIRCTRASLPDLGTPAVYESQKAGMGFPSGRF